MRDHEQRGWAPAVISSVVIDAAEDDDDLCYVAQISETGAPDSWTLSFMECTDADDPQEIGLGMDTYCLVVDPGQATHYGGVRECELGTGLLRLTLTEDAASDLGMPAEVLFTLDLMPQQVDQLSRGLARVLTSGRADAVPRPLHI